MKNQDLTNFLKIGKTFIWVAFIFANCEQNTAKKMVPSHPESPETVCLQWQNYVDNNKIEEARALSTGLALGFVAQLEPALAEDSTEVERMVMLNLKCQIMGDSALCTYHTENELGEPQPGKMALSKKQGKWYVSRVEFEDDILNPDSTNMELNFPGDEEYE